MAEYIFYLEEISAYIRQIFKQDWTNTSRRCCRGDPPASMNAIHPLNWIGSPFTQTDWIVKIRQGYSWYWC